MDRDLKQMANFLATDEVPETLFGIPVVASEDQYTEEDLQFFKEHPEAGGYYDMGEGTPEDGSEEGAPVQNDAPRSKYPGAWNNPGNVRPGKVVYDGESGIARGITSDTPFLTFSTPQEGLNAMGQVIGQIVREKLKGKDFTINNFIAEYAPEKDHNNPNKYAKFLSGQLKVPSNKVLDISDVPTMTFLLRSMIKYENEGDEHAKWFTPAEYKDAVQKMKVPATKLRKELK